MKVVINMIKVVAKHFIKEDQIDLFLTLAKNLVDETLKESGCIHYGLYQDEKDCTILTMLEEWADKASLEKHMASAHFEEIVPQLSQLMSKSPELNIYKPAL
jgi:quinol monooxygenase YgiN